MLSELVDIIRTSNHEIHDGTLFCSSVSIDNDVVRVLQFCEHESLLENTDYETRIGCKTNLELSLARLNSLGFYETQEAFIIKNRYESKDRFYLLDLDVFNDAQL